MSDRNRSQNKEPGEWKCSPGSFSFLATTGTPTKYWRKLVAKGVDDAI